MLRLLKYYKCLIFLQICFSAVSASYAQTDEAVEKNDRTSILLNNGEYLHFLLDKEPNVMFKGDTLAVVSKGVTLSLCKSQVKGIRYFTDFDGSTSGTYTICDDIISFDNEIDTLVQEIKYVRDFDVAGWQDWFVPFEVQAAVLLEDFDIACIDSVYQYDDNGDGCINRLVMEIAELNAGVLKANTPYLIRAKSIGEKAVLVSNSVLEKTVTNAVDISLDENIRCVFKGNYSMMPVHMMEGSCYVFNEGLLVKATEGDILNPFRWFLNIDFACNPCESPLDVEIREKANETSIGDMHVVAEEIVVNAMLGNVVVALFQFDGKMLKSRDMLDGAAAFTIKDLPSGMYIIELGNNTKYKFFKK